MSHPVRSADHRSLWLAVLAVVALALAGCGSSDGSAAEQPASDQPASDQPASDQTASDQTASDQTAPEDDEGAAVSSSGSTDQAMVGDPADVDTIGSLLLASVDESQASRFEGVAELTGEPGSEMPGTFTLTFSGVQDPSVPASDLTVDFSDLVEAMSEAGGSQPANMAAFAEVMKNPMRTITVGDTTWIQWSMLSMVTGGTADNWLETTTEGADDLTASMGMTTFGSPEEVLAPLRDAGADIVIAGQEQVRGVDTTHYRAEVALKDWYESRSSEERAAFDQQSGGIDVEQLSGVVPIELWITDAGRPARINYDMSDPALLGEGGDGISSAVLTIEMFDFGAPDIVITPPPADEVISADQLGMSFGS